MHTTPRMRRAMTIAEVTLGLVVEKMGAEQTYAPFPRNITSFIIYGLEIPIVRLANLTLQAAADYLCILQAEAGLPIRGKNDRSIKGLLHVGPPSNVIFVREDLPDHIANYVLAHELSHLVADVFFIEHLWLKSLPDQKDAIQRAFSWQGLNPLLELKALIKGLPARPQTITDRDKRVTSETIEREIQADLGARELLAPWDTVALLFRRDNRQELISLLHHQFGLPQRVASYYYDDLKRCLAPIPDGVSRLFAPLLPPSSHEKFES